MAKCSRCGQYISGFERNCPGCGAVFTNGFSFKKLLIIILILIALAVPAMLTTFRQQKEARDTVPPKNIEAIR